MGVKLAQRLRSLGPWLVAAAILAFLFRAIPIDKLHTALDRVSPAAFGALTVVFVFATLAADALATWVIYRRSLPGIPLRYGETFRMRGATYLLSVLHYGAGQGGMAYFLKTRYDVPLARAAGAVMLTMGTNAITVAFCATLGIVVGGAPTVPMLRLVSLGLAAGVPVYLGLIWLRPRFLATTQLLAPLFDAGVRGNLAIGAARLPHILVLVVGHFAALRLFGITVPAAQAMAQLPLMFIVSVLPISPQGLGTTQATAVFLFAQYAPGATPDEKNAVVLAYSLAMQFAGTVGQALVGLVFLRLFGRTATLPPDAARP